MYIFFNPFQVAASVAFLIARYFARERILKLVEGNKKFLAIDKAIGENGFRVVTLLRLSPLLPFSLGNYLYGLTSVKFVPYVLGRFASSSAILMFLSFWFLYWKKFLVGCDWFEDIGSPIHAYWHLHYFNMLLLLTSIKFYSLSWELWTSISPLLTHVKRLV